MPAPPRDGNCGAVKPLGSRDAAFAKAPLGKALISHVGTESRDLQVATAAAVQAPPARASSGMCAVML